MTVDFSYDPVSVTDEATASGRTAEIFEDIRATMCIPILTSIWRALASWDDCLERTWSNVKPIYVSRLPELILPEFLSQITLSTPKFKIEERVSTANLSRTDLLDIQQIVNAYNRSNTLNLLALAAHITPASEGAPLVLDASFQNQTSIPLKPLLPRLEITDQNWRHVCEANTLGTGVASSVSSSQHVATLWRHLAYWPSFLSLIYEGFLPQQESGAIDAMSSKSTLLAIDYGAKIARSFNTHHDPIPDRAMVVIQGYVRSPIQVARMVVMGHAISNWLGTLDR
ncbi:MAG: hypothetical protein O3A56_05580 [Proteobacteria bacterium]|nr:hypothetical protein [Pseudomonadota bacterium]MDA0862729.1 hypothetical protein [Pseudomonadota bacterium]MDA1030908.1 hypothetical protein [Pseudomonadota bacterium]